MVKITQDYVSESDRESNSGLVIEHMPLYGIERIMGEDDRLPNKDEDVRFRLKDDDGELLYCGILTDDEYCVNQTAALRWGETMAGASTILVKRGAGYVQEIG